METKIAGAFIRAIAKASQSLGEQKNKVYLVEKPWRGFYVTFEVEPEKEKKIFKVFSCEELGLKGSKIVYLICESLMGQPAQK